MESKGFIQFEIIINVLVGSFRLIWIPMLLVYGLYKKNQCGDRLHTSESDVVRICRAVSNPAWWKIFREISCFSLLDVETLFRCFFPWTRHFTPTCFTWLRCKCEPGRTDMTICTISSMRRNGHRTVCALRVIEMTHEWTGPVTRG